MSELVKLFTCIWLVYREEGSTVANLKEAINTRIIKQKLDTLKVGIPSMIYVVQNNLLYVAASHLDAATYQVMSYLLISNSIYNLIMLIFMLQVTYQLKILTTAMFTVGLLKRKLLSTQWISLMSLVVGVALVQLAQTEPTNPASTGGHEQSKLIGFGAALTACVLSGFAGIYFEIILKVILLTIAAFKVINHNYVLMQGSNVSLWMRNIQLSILSIPFGLFTCLVYDWTAVTTKGFFFGYDSFIWYLVVLQSAGGLLVAMVVKYAGNLFTWNSSRYDNDVLFRLQTTFSRVSPRLWLLSSPALLRFSCSTSI